MGRKKKNKNIKDVWVSPKLTRGMKPGHLQTKGKGINPDFV
jgi:hypothetical protein